MKILIIIPNKKIPLYSDLIKISLLIKRLLCLF